MNSGKINNLSKITINQNLKGKTNLNNIFFRFCFVFIEIQDERETPQTILQFLVKLEIHFGIRRRRRRNTEKKS